MKKLTEKQIQQKLKNGEYSPSEMARMLAERTGSMEYWRLTLRLEHPERYPEYAMSDEALMGKERE